ncbi:hypothetical protein [Actinoplanes sp. NBRC 103695]|uniref:hypothetical protein n=1 Tax=Actinoplanes sp. NBRC 103695 TaxID=3032202 RepID=UPI00255717E2|nr:hypothetical protein [Actinoplanes sp. NBRC 103695]
MGVLEDCAEFINTVGPNASVFRTGSAATPLDPGLEDAVRAVSGSEGHHLLVGTEDVQNPRLAEYVRSATSKGIDLVVDLFDSGTKELVTDPAPLRAAHERLDVAVGTGDGANRIVPDAIVRRQSALRTLAEDTAAPSMSRLVDFLAGLQGEHFDIGTTLGALAALSGELPGLRMTDLAGSNAPMGRFTAERGLATGFERFDLGGVLSQVDQGARALVHGWKPGDTEPQTYLFFADRGQRYWVDVSKGPAGALVETDLEGDDARLVMEQPATRVMLLDVHNQAFPVPAQQARVRDGANPGVTELGAWSAPTAMGNHIREKAASIHDENVILLQVRRGPKKNGQPTLDVNLKRELAEALRSLHEPVIVSTESLEDLNGLATVQYDAKVISPQAVGLDRHEWEVVHRGGVNRDRYFELSADLIRRVLQADSAKENLPPMLESLIRSDSWKAVQQLMDSHRPEISTPENAAILKGKVDAADARAAQPNPLGSGTIGEAPFYLPDRTLPALSVLVGIDARVSTDPRWADKESMEPSSPFLTDETRPANVRFDAQTVLGYLTNRAMSLPSDERLEFNMAVVRLRDMFRPLTTDEYGPLTARELEILLGAKGEFADERAQRQPGAPELDLGHAAVAKMLGEIYDQGLTSVDPDRIRTLVDAIDCFTGEIRVGYHYLFKLVSNSDRPHEAFAVNQISDELSLCH